MSRRNMPRVFVRLVVLTTLVGALFFTPADMTRNTVHADPWCPACDEEYYICMAGCPLPGEPGRIACTGYCNNVWRECEIYMYSTQQC